MADAWERAAAAGAPRSRQGRHPLGCRLGGIGVLACHQSAIDDDVRNEGPPPRLLVPSVASMQRSGIEAVLALAKVEVGHCQRPMKDGMPRFYEP